MAQNKTQTKAMTAVDEVRSTIMSEPVKEQLRMALPKQMPVERFQRVAMTAINNMPALLTCVRQSLYNAFMLCAQDGLLPDSREAVIIPFKDKAGNSQATYIPMVGGILKKIRNSGEVGTVTAELVREHDPFEYRVDERGPHLTHEPDPFLAEDERGPIRGVYCVAMTKGGQAYVEVMSVEQVEKVRAISKTGHKPDSPWAKWWDQMAKKSVIRRIAKRLPMSTDLDDVLRRDDHMYDAEAKVVDKPRPASAGPSRLGGLLGVGEEPAAGDPITDDEKREIEKREAAENAKGGK